MTARLMNVKWPWAVLVAACWVAFVVAAPTRTFAMTNLFVQFAIFIPAACIPAWRTGRMTYVDFAWPTGLAAIGIQTFLFAASSTPLTIVVATCYTIVGGRAAIWAGATLLKTRLVTEELPRYQYQRLRWAEAGHRNEQLSIQSEIGVQLTTNFAFLAVPAYVATTDTDFTLNVFEIIAIAVWAVAYMLESLADLQKNRFAGNLTSTSRPVCDVGLWRYSRHPNYFFHWIQWVALVGLVVPSAVELAHKVPAVTTIVAAASLLLIILMMYYTLVYYTGAIPAEYYSLRKRPAYADYQATVNRFFPGPRKRAMRSVE